MTPTDRTPDDGFWFARLDNKLDDIRNTIGGHGEELAEHRVRLDGHDREFAGIHAAMQTTEQHQSEERRHRSLLRWTMGGSVLVGVTGLVSGLIALLH